MNALLITLAVAGLSLLSSVFAANTVFVWLLSLAGLGAQIGWIAITASQIAFRRSYIRQGGKVEDLKFKAPLYPVIPILGLLANCIVMVSLAFDPRQRLALYCGGILHWMLYRLLFKSEKSDELRNKPTRSPIKIKSKNISLISKSSCLCGYSFLHE